MPYAALNRPAYGGLRLGEFGSAQVNIAEGWDLARVRPIFGEVGTTSSCVLFGRRERAGPLPRFVERFSGLLNRRNASELEADTQLRHTQESWPPGPSPEGTSPYRRRFRNGATIYPRRLFIVEREARRRLGDNQDAPRVRGKRGAVDNVRWRDVEPPRGPIEVQFLRPILLGESIAPFRILTPALGAIPAVGNMLIDAIGAAEAGHRWLAAWLRDVEAKWNGTCSKAIDGSPRLTLIQQIDHLHKLTIQLETENIKVV